ncbi:efflux RND transporter periplasmic adaptor subunit [Moheibacter lacus]|uniref:Efflux RND transporter periplasmic adaptor subunit n=1 Tax=Moheibacter lacus TaxID=2745851 RepID=A0A838ZQ68_9FLAO|nr:efflux RND transporter periplasmic adaptor subunit [Moheibacter lacus]MBA5629847.1 efflux RND transporter periplasmic adaptor subunit [Moheibacter lacus]
MKNRTLYLMLGIVLIGMVQSCKKDNAGSAQQGMAKPYPVVSVPKDSITAFAEYPASIEGVVNSDVRAKITGYITKVYVDEGQFVQKGQALFKLETNTLSQDASAARSGVSASESSVAAAKAAVDAAQIEVNKLVPLVEKKIISSVQLETARANLLSAQSQHKQAQASYLQSQANYKSAAANLGYGTVYAPVSGVVGSLPLREGNLVGPNDATPLTVISDVSELYAYFSMNEKEYLDFLENNEGKTLKEKIKNLPPVKLKLANGSMYSEEGKIEAVTGQIDPQTGTIQFRVHFDNENGLLTNGNSGSIMIPQLYPDVLVVPESSTFEQQGITYVYKVEKDTAVSTIIGITARANNMAIINNGLKEGDKIVATGVGNLRTGTAIQPQPANFDSIVQSIKPVFK